MLLFIHGDDMKRIGFLLLFITILIFNTSSSLSNLNTRSYNVNVNKNTNLNNMSIKVQELIDMDKNIVIDIFNGKLTGYTADCPLCSGNLACTGKNYIGEEPYYQDEEYDKVNIVASSANLKCGSIVSFKLNNKDVTAIVLDRGVLGTDIDLLVKEKQEAINNIGRKNINYSLLRDGYNN